MTRTICSARLGMLVAALAAMFAAWTPAHASEAARPFSAPRDPDSYGRALQCLTEAVYYEARSESADGQRAVAQVVLNRVRHPAYPNSVCGVVYQGSHRRTGCQFTFTCDGSITGFIEANAWARAQEIASAALDGYVHRPVGLALNYHTTAIRPYWAPSLVPQAVIGAHIFYRPPGSAGGAAFRQAPASVEPHSRYASVPVTRSRSGRSRADFASRVETAQVVRPQVERPVVQQFTIERPQVERPTMMGQARSSLPRSNRTAARSAPQRTQAQATMVPRGPRTTIESGVRVAR